MDIGISALMILVILFLLYRIDRQAFLQNKVHGDKGESLVSKELVKLDSDFVVYDDVHLGHCQIDHLVINYKCKVIFVIETKNWAGIVKGEVNDDKWNRYKNDEVGYFNNPIKQNKKHCSEVRKRYKDYSIHNVVVFVKDNAPNHRAIVRMGQLVSHIYKTTERVTGRVYNEVYNSSMVDV